MSKASSTFRRTLLWSTAALALLAIAGWLAAPPLIARQMRRELIDLPGGYSGDIDHVELRLWNAEVAFLGLRLEKRKPHIPVPFLQARELVLGFTLDGLRPRNTLRVVDPVVNLVDGRTPADDQWGPDFELETLREKLPFELVEARMEGGQVHLREFQARPQVDAFLTGLEVRWTELAHCLPPGTPACRSRLHVRARAMDHANLSLTGRFERRPEDMLVVAGSLRDLNARLLNPMLRRYAKVDLQKGTVGFDLRFQLQGKRYMAMVVPKANDIEVLGGDKSTPFGREMGLALAAGWFERQRGEKAVRFSGYRGPQATDFTVVDYKIVDTPNAARKPNRPLRPKDKR